MITTAPTEQLLHAWTDGWHRRRIELWSHETQAGATFYSVRFMRSRTITETWNNHTDEGALLNQVTRRLAAESLQGVHYVRERQDAHQPQETI